MDDHLVIEKLHNALNKLIEKDHFLLTNDLSEQSMTHKLAEYLQVEFPDFNVDCEYNGSVHDQVEKKKIRIVRDRLAGAGLLRDSETESNEEIITRSVFPDIIIHQRGNHDHNLCNIEFKKTSSNVSYDYDFIKLQAYTSPDIGNILKYQLGVFVEVFVGETIDCPSLKVFKNGVEIDYNSLRLQGI